MVEYKISQPEYKERSFDEVVQSDNSEDVQKLASEYRSMIYSDDVRNGGSIHACVAFCGNLVIFGAADKYLYALDKSTGALVWKFLTGDAIASSVFVDNGSVFFGSYDGYVYALRATDGSLIWKFRTGDFIFSSPVVAKGILYIGSADTYLYALRVDDGTLLWKFKTGNLLTSSARVVGDFVFVPSEDWYVYALDAFTGSLKWKFRATGIPTELAIVTNSGRSLSRVYREPVEKFEPSVIWFGTWGSDHIYALDALTGRLLDHYKAQFTTPCQPLCYGGVLYVGSADQHMYAIESRGGRVLWKLYTGGMISASSWIQNGIVYFGSYDQYVYAARACDGKPLWKFRTDGVITASPVMDGNVLYVGSWDTYMYVIDTANRKLLWKFKTNAPPSVPSFVDTMSTFSRIKRVISRWWKPEQSRMKVYDTQMKPVQSDSGAGSYRMSNPYKSDIKYESQGLPGYQMGKEKKDLREPWKR